MRNTLRRKQNPYLFLKIGEERERLRRVCVWTLCHLRRFRQRRQWIVTKDWGKTEKGFCFVFFFKKTASFSQNTRFSRLRQVARVTRQNTSSLKIWKKFLSIFATRSLTREGVASWATKISVYPSQLDLLLANKSPKPTRKLVAVSCDLDDLWLSCQNRATLFLKFFSFCKNKIFSKNT